MWCLKDIGGKVQKKAGNQKRENQETSNSANKDRFYVVEALRTCGFSRDVIKI